MRPSRIDLSRPEYVASALGVFFHVILMVFLGIVKSVRGFDFGRCFFFEDAGPVEFRLRFLGCFSLLIGMIEYHGTVLRADIRTLPVDLGRIMQPPEIPEQLLVGDFIRIIFNLHRFRMARRARTYHLIRRIFQMTASVTDLRCDNSPDLREDMLHSPEASGSEGCGQELNFRRVLFL